MRKLLDRLLAAIADDQNAQLVDEGFVWAAIGIGMLTSYLFFKTAFGG